VSDGPRYAIYFVPAPESDLHRFGSAVIGYDCHTGADVAHPRAALASEASDQRGDSIVRAPDTRPEPGSSARGLSGHEADWAKLTHEPRQYGFHATLKAPFFLSPASSETQLANALENFATFARSVPTIVPAVSMLGNFIAIVPRERDAAVDALAADCVTIFDAFRAPMSPQERARRVAAGLSHRQTTNLDRWGYPYLFDEFRFHMTLTGPLPPGRRNAILAVLQEQFANWCGDHPIMVDRLALLRQDDAGARFRVVSQAALGG
jgi:hypothetical protein